MITAPLRVAGAAVATALAGSAAFATPALAAEGEVVSGTNLTVRYGPTTASRAVGSVPPGTNLEIVCKVRGTSVDGNDLWYLLPPSLNEWVSARYVSNVGSAPGYCGTSARYDGRTTAALTKRTGPTSAAGAAGTLSRGAAVRIICKLPGQSVDGNNRWYHLTDGRWVAARYVENVGAAPGFCND